MLVTKKKYNKLKHNYNRLVDTKNNFEHSYNQSQYKCITLNHKESIDTQYIYAYTIREAIEMLHKMQNVTRIIDIWEVK